MSYESFIDINKQNNTAAILEKYFWNKHGVKKYDSIVDTSPVDLKKTGLPEVSQLNTITPTKLYQIKDFIINASKYKKINRDLFLSELCEFHPIIDLLIAYNIAEILDEKNEYASMDELNVNWLKIIHRNEKEIKEAIKSEEKNNLLAIDTSKFSVGMVIKNYKKLCELLNEETRTGNARIAQLKEFKRYFNWQKSGQKFIITDIYTDPLEKEDKRKFGNNSIYVKYIEVILLKYLSKKSGYTQTLTKRKWWELLGIVNHKYATTSTQELEKLDYTVTEWEIKHFYQRCNKKLEEILFSALNSLKSRKLITYEVQTIIVKRDENCREIYTEATDVEKKMILEVEYNVLHNIFKYEKIIQVFLKFQQKEFYKKVNEILFDKYGWDYCFKQIKIIYVPDGVRQIYPELEAKLQQELSLMLNKEVCDVVEQNARKKYEKMKKEHAEWEEKCWTDILNNDDKIIGKQKEPIVPQNYLDAQSILKDELIKIGNEKIAFSPKDFIKNNDDIDTLFDFELTN